MSFQRRRIRERATRLGSLVVGSTLALTMAFFGVVALVTGNAAGALERLPFYVLASAGAFVGGLVLLDESKFVGEEVLAVAAGAGVTAFLLVGLGGEGVLYAARYPEQVVSSQLFVYVLSAGMFATGLGFWAARHYNGSDLAGRNRL